VGTDNSRVLAFIRSCVEMDEAGDPSRLEVTGHFRDRMRTRGLFWPDVVAILLQPERLELRGKDEENREQVWVFGEISTVGPLRIVCSIDWDTRLITLNWEPS
jgi:hypothetical protein